MFKAATDSVHQAMTTAQSEARSLNQEFVGTEHVLLGILRCETCEAASALQRNGPKVASVHDALRHALPHGKETPVITGDLPLSPRAKRAIQDAIVKAAALREEKVSTRFLFLSLLDEPDTIIRSTLRDCGADLGQLQRLLAEKPAQAEAQEEASHMSEIFADRFFEAIERKGAPICVGIDPIFEMVPDAVAGDAAARDPNDAEACIDAIFAFTTKVLQIVAPHVPIVKFQSAYFEKYLWEGVEAYYSLVQEASEMGLLVIGDVKRGDIGSTCAAYAAAHLEDPPFSEMGDVVVPDAITVNPMLGMDTLDPFVQSAKDAGKGLFVLVRTSNPGSADLQDAKLADGRTWSEMLADFLRTIAATEGLVGAHGYSSIGAVVGATQPHTMKSLRDRLPQSIFLLPGYGTQGATADMTRAAFREGKGAIVSASRSILYAHRDQKHAGKSWEDSVQDAVRDMRDELAHL